MKKLAIAAVAGLGFVTLLLYTATLGFDTYTRARYYWDLKHPAAPAVTVPVSNWMTQDDSGRAEREGFSERPAPKDHPPARIRIDGDEFTVHYALRSDLLRNGSTAQIAIHDKQIWLAADDDGREIREALFHELMHAALYKAGGEYQHPVMSDEGDGEPVINPTARMLPGILRDNPRLVQWLARAQP